MRALFIQHSWRGGSRNRYPCSRGFSQRYHGLEQGYYLTDSDFCQIGEKGKSGRDRIRTCDLTDVNRAL